MFKKLIILFYAVLFSVIITMLYFDNYIDGTRIRKKIKCGNDYWEHLYDYKKCERKCFYKGQPSDDCVFLDIFIFSLPIICLSKHTIFDSQFLHFCLILGFWYCVINLSTQSISFPQLINYNLYNLGFILPIMHIIYEKSPSFRHLKHPYLFFVTYWIIGINIDLINEAFNLELTLTGDFLKYKNETALILFCTITPIVFCHQLFMIIHNKRLLWSIFYVIGILLIFIVPFTLAGLKIHIHHYLLSLFMMPLISGDDIFTTIIWGATVGFFVNGIAVWGVDPLFY